MTAPVSQVLSEAAVQAMADAIAADDDALIVEDVCRYLDETNAQASLRRAKAAAAALAKEQKR